MILIGGEVLGWKDGGAGGQAMGESVEGGTLFAVFGTRAGRVLRIRAIDGAAVGGGAGGLSSC